MSPHSVRRPLAVLLLIAYLAACTSWRVQQASPAAVVLANPGKPLRVAGIDGQVSVLTVPHLSGDSLLGVSRGNPVALALSDVTAVAIRQSDGLKSVGLVVLLAGGLLIVAAALASDPLKDLKLCLQPPCEEP